MPEKPVTTTDDDIREVREAMKIAAMAKPTPIWECAHALPAFERLVELIDNYVPKVFK